MEAGVASSTVSTFTDPDAYHAAIRHTHAEGIVTGRGQFRAELTLVRLDRVSLPIWARVTEVRNGAS
jgi:hypothetical protein